MVMSSLVTAKWIYENAGRVIDDVRRGNCKVPLNEFERVFNCAVIDTDDGVCVMIDGEKMPTKGAILDFVKSYPN